MIDELLKNNADIIAMSERYSKNIANAKKTLGDILSHWKLQCVNDERLPYFDAAERDADAHFEARGEYISSLFKKNAEEICLLCDAFRSVDMAEDERAKEFVLARHQKHLSAFVEMEKGFTKELTDFMLQTEEIYKKLAG